MTRDLSRNFLPDIIARYSDLRNNIKKKEIKLNISKIEFSNLIQIEYIILHAKHSRNTLLGRHFIHYIFFNISNKLHRDYYSHFSPESR